MNSLALHASVVLLASLATAHALDCSHFSTFHNGVLAPLYKEKRFMLKSADDQQTFMIGICQTAAGLIFPDSAALLAVSGTTVKLGLLNSTQLLPGTGWLLLVYSGGDPYPAEDSQCNKSRHAARLLLSCDPAVFDGQLALIGEVRNEATRCHHLFELRHYTLCGLVPPPAAGAVLTPVAATFVALLAAFCAYLALGMAVQRFCLGRRGAAQIPNYTAWRRLGNAAASCCDLVCRSEPRPARPAPEPVVASGASAGGGGGVTTHHLFADEDDDHLLPA